VAASEIPVTLTRYGGEDRRNIKQPRSGMLTEPCRGIFMQSGRRIFN
jgi:hypothetical protein